jgi:hypothetical protein
MRMTRLMAMVATVAGCASEPVVTERVEHEVRQAPLTVAGPRLERSFNDQYIVMWKVRPADPAVAAAAVVNKFGGKLVHVYGHALSGFAARLTLADALAIARLPNVAHVEADQAGREDVAQYPAIWGLDRIDQHDAFVNNTYHYADTGRGVNAYVIDSGLRASHHEFAGRAQMVYSVTGEMVDCRGHGTHVAGTIGGKTYGVAKRVNLKGVRVSTSCNLNLGGYSTSDTIAGMDWVAANRVLPAVANISIGHPPSTAIDTAVTGLVNAGVVVAVSAGNDASSACDQSPARAAAAITVGASEGDNSRHDTSNYGTCVDLFAPGKVVLSAAHDSDTATDTKSGTSMASPHVAGVAALYLEDHPTDTPAQVTSAILGVATVDALTDIGAGSPNLLLYSGFCGTLPCGTQTVLTVIAGTGGRIFSWPPMADVRGASEVFVVEPGEQFIMTSHADWGYGHIAWGHDAASWQGSWDWLTIGGNTTVSASYSVCGDSFCAWGENAYHCPQDCPMCGNGTCDFTMGDDATTCPGDCWCGDGVCDGSEDVGSCAADCTGGGDGYCGNGVCEGSETWQECPQDCS